MIYLDILVGFSLVMLVFASAVSVMQTMLKRVLAIKGAALARPLLDEIEHEWSANQRLSTLGEEGWRNVHAWLDRSLRSRHGRFGEALRTMQVTDAHGLLDMLRDEGDAMLGQADPEHRAEWQALVSRLERRWDGLTDRLSQSYEQRTKRWVFALSVVAVLAFNVDAIRILRVLSVSPTTRTRLETIAEEDEVKHDDGRPMPSTLSDWQKENLAEIAATGLPLGWDKAALAICRYPSGETEGRLWDTRCHHKPDMRMSLWLSLWLWLVRLLGMFIGAGLIAQGAPFWYSVLDSVFGLKGKGAQPAGASPASQAVRQTRVAEAGGQPPYAVAAAGPEAQPARDLSGKLQG
jgi:hypothetical protein